MISKKAVEFRIRAFFKKFAIFLSVLIFFSLLSSTIPAILGHKNAGLIFADPLTEQEDNILKLDDTGTTGGNYIQFLNSSGSNAGTINHASSTAVTYNTTSDYRLKNVTNSVTGQGARIDALKPIDYQWKEGGQQARGFLAHEFQEIYASSVTGTKDAVDADGNPVYQGMQASSAEVIADLVAEIQSLRKRLTALESA